VIRGHVTKQGSRLVRWAAVEAVQVLPYDWKLRANRDGIAAGRGRAIGKLAAARRKLLTLVYCGLRDDHIRCLDKERRSRPFMTSGSVGASRHGRMVAAAGAWPPRAARMAHACTPSPNTSAARRGLTTMRRRDERLSSILATPPSRLAARVGCRVRGAGVQVSANGVSPSGVPHASRCDPAGPWIT
jgi:hypothetical protein